MIGVRQTLRGGPDASPGFRGNCMGACLASMLELPMSMIPDPPPELDVAGSDTSPWWGHYESVLGDLGFFLLTIKINRWWNYLADHKITWKAVVPSLNIPPTERTPDPLHAIVMRGQEVAWDPSRGKRYEHVSLHEIRSGDLLVPIDPART